MWTRPKAGVLESSKVFPLDTRTLLFGPELKSVYTNLETATARPGSSLPGSRRP
jgi:hypothetical protein